jgi:hypothetical protein
MDARAGRRVTPDGRRRPDTRRRPVTGDPIGALDRDPGLADPIAPVRDGIAVVVGPQFEHAQPPGGEHASGLRERALGFGPGQIVEHATGGDDVL